MNSKNTTGTDGTRDLTSILSDMEKAGAPWHERAAAAVNFLESQGKLKPSSGSASCGSSVEDEELPVNGDAAPSDSDANPTDSNAASRGSHAHPPGGSSQPPPADDKPWPPKLPFGLGNPLWEPALDMCSYMDKRSPLDRLSLAQQNAVAKLLQDYDASTVVELLAKKEPAGFSLHVSESALNRFRHRHKRRQQLRKSQQFVIECERLLREAADNDDQAFLHASERLLKMRLCQMTFDPNASLDSIDQLTEIITRLRKQSLAERKLAPSENAETETENSIPDPARSGAAAPPEPSSRDSATP